jgi:GTP-binding protein EngB required for normal cell division
MSVRLFIIVILALVSTMVLFLVLIATDTALSVWQRLSDAPLWLQIAYAILLLGFSFAAVAVTWRWLRPKKKMPQRSGTREVSAESLQEGLLESAREGVDISAALQEIREQRRRKEAGEVHIAVFGEVSTGKSSLVRALLPEATVKTDPRAGTTTDIRHYRWRADSGDSVVIADLPGFNLDEDSRLLEEARRAHLVVFLCDGDLTRTQMEQLGHLQELGKPLVLALNKMDRYTGDEVAAIVQRISAQSRLPQGDIVTIRTGGREEVVRLLSDGTERSESRSRPTDISLLRASIQGHLDQDRELMEALRDTAVLLLATEKLEAARDQHREQQAEQLVSKYARRAVVGALAAVAPGSDLVIQGVLATRLVQELCQLYEVSVKDVQVESFLKLAGGKLRNMSALTMAIAGNALKAFPGLGTISGGLMHAVAYGLIFDSLGRAAAQTLSSRGDLRPYPAAQVFEDLLRENLESGAGRFARLAIAQGDRTEPS